MLKKYKKIAIFLGLLSTVLFSNATYATSINLSVNSTISTSILPTDLSGTTATSNTTTPNITINTDDETGYRLLIQSSSSTATALTSANGGSISSITSATASVADFSNGTWGYKPTKKNGSSWSNLTVGSYAAGYFLPAPTIDGDIIDSTNSANTTNNEYNIAIATKIGSETTMGTYSESFTIVAISNSVPVGYTLTFEANGGNFSGSPINTIVYSIPELVTHPTVTVNGSTTNSTTNQGTHKTSINDSTAYASNATYYQDLVLDTSAPGPYTLTLYYSTESTSCDWICVFDGTSYTPTSSDGCTNASALAAVTNTGTAAGKKIGGGGSNSSTYQKVATFQVTRKTARIYFRSDSSVTSYGFWAEFVSGGEVVTQEIISGSYAEPTSTERFLGWSTSASAIIPDWTYDPNAMYEENKTVYAVWAPNCNPTATTISDAVCMQDMNSNIISSMTTGTQYRLYDSRDYKMYYVAKQADGQVWMTQNLDLDLSTTTKLYGNYTGTISDGGTAKGTDIGWNASTNTYDSGSTSSYYWAPNANTNGYQFSSSYKSYSVSKDVGEQYYVTSGSTSSYDISYTSKSSCEEANTAETCAHSHAGNYYNWNAATAGKTTLSDYTVTSSSICPYGWRMVYGRVSKGSNSTEFSRLLYSANVVSSEYANTSLSFVSGGFNRLRASPLYFVRAGAYAHPSIERTGSGYYWFGNSVGSSYVAAAWFDYNTVFPNNSTSDTYKGYNMRCVARNPKTYTLSYDTNGGSGSSFQSQTAIGDGYAAFTIPSNLPKAPAGYTFAYWALSATGLYSAGSSIKISKDETLSATYTASTIDLNFYNSSSSAGCPTSVSNMPSAKTAYVGFSGTYVSYTWSLSATGISCPGYTLKGWATSSDSTTAQYSVNGGYTISGVYSDPAAAKNIYAVWTPDYTLTYDANAGSDTVTNLPDPQTSSPAISSSFAPTTATFVIASTTPTRSGYTFTGWGISSDAASGYYVAGDSYTASSASTTLYAMWGTSYSITYDANGGSGAPATQSGAAAAVTIPSELPTLTDKCCIGWALSDSATEAEFLPGHSYSVSNFAPTKTLYAVWADGYPVVTVYGSTTNSTTNQGTHKTSINDSTAYVNNASYYQDLVLDTSAPGPYTLTLYYSTESTSWDWICVFDGTSYTPTSSDGCTDASALSATTNTGTAAGKKIGGGGSNSRTYQKVATFQVTSKTARIYFRSDTSSVSYGFWAEFTGGGI